MKKIFLTQRLWRAGSDGRALVYELVIACMREETAEQRLSDDKKRRNKLEKMREEAGARPLGMLPVGGDYSEMWRPFLGVDGMFYATKMDVARVKAAYEFEDREDVRKLKASITGEKRYIPIELIE